MLLAFSDELRKIAAMKPPPLRQALTAGSNFSANALKPTSLPKHVVPAFGTGASASKIAPQLTPASSLRGVNIRPQTTVDPKLPLSKGTPPASPVHVAPQVNPQAATIQQGAPQTINSTPAASSGAGAQSPGQPSAPKASGGASASSR